jgi:pimeloyl-ACP methyl ester carboxylesterase
VLLLRGLKWLLYAVLALVVVVTLASVGYNLATSDPNVPVEQLWHGKFVEADGVKTAYREWGSHGHPIVLVGGFLEPASVWEQVAPLLAVGFHVYALDLDGFGYTKRRGPYTLAEWGDQVQGLIRALHLRKPVIVGHSLGAAVAVEEARRGNASAIVLVDGDALRGGGPPKLVTKALVHLPFFTTAFRIAVREPWIVRRILRNAYGPRHPAFDEAELERWTDPLRAQGARQALQEMAGHGIPGFTRAQLRTVHTPAFVVWGAADHVDPESAGRQTARDLHAPFVSVHDAGHLSMLADASRVALAIARAALP